MVRVVERGSFPAVAREHKVRQAAIARQIAQPEEGSASREISATDQFTNPTALTGPATSLTEISPMTSTAETRSTDSQADGGKGNQLHKRAAMSRPFVSARHKSMNRIAGDNKGSGASDR